MENVPEKSAYTADAICSLKSLISELGENSPILTDWISFNFRTFFLLREGTNPQTFQEELNKAYHNHSGELQKAQGMVINLLIKPIDEVYLKPFGSSNPPITYVYIFSLVAFFILLIACVNFMNLSTARSANRAKEVGIRKVMGSERKRLILQFISESVFLAMLSLMFALLLTWLCIPVLGNIIGSVISMEILFNPVNIASILAATLLVGVLAGLYPAFILSSFNPAIVLKGNLSSGSANSGLRKILVISQFVISIVLIIGSSAVYKQLEYLRSKDPGFNKEQTLILSLPKEKSGPSIETLKTEFKSLSSVINVSAASTLPGWGSAVNSKLPEGFTTDQVQLMDEINVDRDFVKTMGMEIVKGRDFSSDFGEYEKESILINETAAKQYGWNNPIGKTIRTPDVNNWNGKNYVDMKVIGVVKDFHLDNMMREIHPAFIGNNPYYPFTSNKYRVLIIRLAKGDLTNSIAEVEAKWASIIPDVPFKYEFMDEIFNSQFGRIIRAQTIITYFTILLVLISCLGLFGLISYLSELKTKEIGIRKALGASLPQLISILIKDYSLWILIANLIAIPVAYYVVNSIFQNFAYKAEFGIGLFILSGFGAFLVGLLTILWHVIKTAKTNPIEALKYE